MTCSIRELTLIESERTLLWSELIGEIPIPIVLYGKRRLKSKCKCSVISCI